MAKVKSYRSIKLNKQELTLPMKHIILSITLSLSVALGFLIHNGVLNTKTVEEAPEYSAVVLPWADVLDSLILIELYNATDGDNWSVSWDTNTPVCTWVPPVQLDVNGKVEQIVLSNNNLVGTIPPDLGGLAPTLNLLQLDNNQISGNIPSEIGDCTLLGTLFLDNNELTGTIPESFGQLVNLTTLFLDNNQLTGTVPEEFLDMISLQDFDMFNNCIDSIPDLSSMISLQPNSFRVYNNKLTFDDLLPNEFEIGTYYEDQDSFGTPITICLPTGLDTFVDLGIDAGITTNSYAWFKNGSSYATTTINKLFFTPVDWSDAGVYTANVTNSVMTDLTLWGRPITVKVICGESFNYINQDYCSGSGASVTVGATTFNEAMPSGSVTVSELDQYGCDSTVVVNLNFHDSPSQIIDTMICPGDSIVVNGEVYNQSNDTGTENLGPIALFGCDSLIEVNVSFFSTTIANLNPTICLEDTFYVYGNPYYFGKATGMDTISGIAFHGCDSIINVNVSFLPMSLEVFDDVLCSGGSVMVNGTEYNESNPSDTITLDNASLVTGCDSTIYVDLTFGPGVEMTIDDMLCVGDSMVVGGTVYNQGNPSGSEDFMASSPSECDTTVFIDLSFYTPDTGYYNPVVCLGESIDFNGTTYDAGMPNGFEAVTSPTFPACDSIIEVQLTFITPPVTTIDTILCPGESITVNMIVYDFLLTSGVEFIPGVGQGVCDSTINVNVSFFPEAIGTIDTTLCDGGSIEIDGVTYDESNPTDTIVFGGSSFYGCDSTVIINVDFFSEVIVNLDTTICDGEVLMIEGNLYDITTPTGSFVSGTSSFQGCDSTIVVSVSFFPEALNEISDTLCFGESLMVNNETYNAANPTDTIVLGGASFYQCDSTIYVSLEFREEATGVFNTTLCPGDSIEINNVWYHEGNTTGTEVFSMGSFYQCDSTVTITVDFYPEAENTIDSTLCFGESLMIGGMQFDASNPTDTIVLSGVTANGCDSSIIVNLSFYAEAYALFDDVLCFGQQIEINGVIYNELNPMGFDTIPGGSFHMCDSIIEVNLTFNNAVQVTFDNLLCLDESMIINDTLYDVNNPSGTDTIPMGSYLGCDSIIIVDLQFPSGPAESTIDGIYCPDFSVLVNGELYDIDNPMGEELFGSGSSLGCDSTVYIDLEFFAVAESTIDTTLCPGGMLVIENVVFDEANPSGEVVLENESFNNCDSTIFVNLSFHAPVINIVDPIYCEGQSITIEGVVYDIDNPTDTVITANPTFYGCDSTIYINLTFSDAIEITIDTTLCPGDELIVNGTTYNEAMPTGVEMIEMGVCDSIINVNLSFYDEADLTFDLVQTICPEDTLFVNGVPYHIGNPSGSEILTGESYTTCDSIVNVDLSFYPPAINNFTATLCPGDSVVINNTVYNESNPTGAELIPDASFYGCDSLIQINLSFYSLGLGFETPTICAGESIEINGTLYDESNQSGTDTLFGMSYTNCDSMVQVTLSFYEEASNNLTEEICEGESYQLGGMTYDVSGTYSEVLEGVSYQGCDSTVNLNLTVLSAQDIGLADAGPDQDICDEEAALSANVPFGTTGVWTNLEDAFITNPNSANTSASDFTAGEYTFIWTLSNAICSDYDSDTLTIFIGANPEANDDVYNVESDVEIVELSLLDNDLLNGVTDWYLEIPSPPAGNLTDLGNGNFEYEPEASLLGTTTTFEYLLCNEACTHCDTALVTLLLAEPNNDFPNTITPNGDGKNDTFIIPDLETDDPTQFITRELIIFNRWGDVVYQVKPYLNDWEGTNQNGDELPQGTYYYTFRLVLADGKIYNGDITILR